MIDTRPATREMFVNPVDISLGGASADFDHARAAAEKVVAEHLTDPLLLAWFDRARWTHSPSIC